jgi:hypothetical protein
MPSHFQALFLLALVSLAAHGQQPAQPPTMPTPGVDTVLMQGKTPEAFFGERKQKTACRAELATLRTAYRTEAKALETLKGSSDADAIEAQGEKREAAREKYLDKLAECGPCARRDLEVIKVTGEAVLRPQNWYVADGSCLIEGLSGADLEKAFSAAVDDLLTPDFYRHYAGGLPTVLEYQVIDAKTGAKIANAGKQKLEDPFLSFIAIRGPSLFGASSSFGYLYKNDTKLTAGAGGIKEYAHLFKVETPPRGFQFPATVIEHLPSGATNKVRVNKLTKVHGMFYVSSDGYFRYHTAADVGLLDLGFARRLAQTTLFATLQTLHERAVGEAP